MSLNFLLDAREAENHPVALFLVSFFYTLLAIVVSVFISSSYASMLMVFFAVVALVPLFYRVVTLETKRTEQAQSKLSSFSRHSKAVSFLLVLFLGMVCAYLLWYLATPNAAVVFSAQLETINSINIVTGNVVGDFSHAHVIFLKNLRLLILTFALSVMFGVSALLIFSWNASVISVAIGQFIESLGGPSLSSIALGASRYLIHGLMEMVSYFIATLAGAMIFIELLNWKSEIKTARRQGRKLSFVARDVGLLFLASVVLLYVSAMVEVVVHSAF